MRRLHAVWRSIAAGFWQVKLHQKSDVPVDEEGQARGDRDGVVLQTAGELRSRPPLVLHIAAAEVCRKYEGKVAQYRSARADMDVEKKHSRRNAQLAQISRKPAGAPAARRRACRFPRPSTWWCCKIHVQYSTRRRADNL